MYPPLVPLIMNIAERVNDFYSSLIAFGLMGCSLAPIVFNLEKTLNLLPTTA